MRAVGRPRSSPSWLAAGAAFSGGCTYVLLVVTARAVGPAAYGRFSLFWAAIVITSLGLFLPVEQVIARRSARSDSSPAALTGLLRSGLRRGAVLAGLAVVVYSALLLVRWGTEAGVLAVLLAFAVASAGFVAQFPARGVLGGRIALREYAAVIAVDAGLRAIAAVSLWLAGVTAVAAYATAVGLSSLACGLVGIALVRRCAWQDVAGGATAGGAAPPAVAPQRIGREELTGTVTAALSMQLLLNSAIVVAGLVGTGPDAVLAGHLLAVIMLARLPVFVFQAGQAAYVGRVATRAHAGDLVGLRRLLGRLAALVAAVACLTVVGAAVVGPQAVRLVFGAEYDISRGAATLVALGVAAYLVASVSNDVAVALGEHLRLGLAWATGIASACLVAALVPDLVLRATLPLLVGSVVAAAVLLPAVRHRANLGSRPWRA